MMKSETWRKIQAVFLIATIAGAEVQNVEKAVRFNNVMNRLRSPSRASAASENNVKPESNQIGNALLDKLFGSTIHSSSLNQGDLDETTLGNIGKLFESAMPSELKQGHLDKNILERLGDMSDHSMDDLANQFVNKLFDKNGESWQKEGLQNLNPGDEDKAKLENLGKMFESAFDQKKLDASSLHQEDLEKTVLGHLSNLAKPASHVSARATLPMRSLRPFSRPALGGRERGIPTRSINGDRSINAQRAFQPPVQPKPFNPLAPRFNPLSKRPVFTQAASGATPGDGEGGFLDKIKSSLPPATELKKMLPLASMFFSILFVYTILRDTKDVLVVTSGGAEVIPFLKTYMNLPAAIGFTALYATLVNRMTNVQIFYTLISTFGIFFGLFATVIYPNRALVHPIAWASNLQATLPVGFGPLLAIIKYWTFGLFYTMAELWGSVVVSLLFWGFANDICSVPEGKKWYPLFGLIANVALIFSGQFIRIVSDLRSQLPPGVDAWGYTLNILSVAIVIGASVVMGIYTYMQQKVLTDPACMPPGMQKKEKKKKPKMGLGESFKYLVSSSYIRNLAFLVIAYGTSINIVEVTWKGKLKEAFPDPNDYSSFMGAFSSTTGCITLGMMLLGRWILNRFGWGVGALVTPTMLGVTGITFFSLIVFKEAYAPLTAMLGLTPLMMAVFMGAAQNILSKASKYSLFDPCKETAYIPLDSEMRTKGKASIDVIGNPLGKSSGAFIQQGALLTCGSLAASAPFLGSVLVGMVGLWVVAAKNLAVEFEEKAAAMEKESKDDKPE